MIDELFVGPSVFELHRMIKRILSCLRSIAIKINRKQETILTNNNEMMSTLPRICFNIFFYFYTQRVDCE